MKVGCEVMCIKEDKMDDICNIKKELRWQIGDRFIVAKIEKTPWGTFLYDDNGHNLDIRRALIIK